MLPRLSVAVATTVKDDGDHIIVCSQIPLFPYPTHFPQGVLRSKPLLLQPFPTMQSSNQVNALLKRLDA